jgi:hypothetical protein
MRDIFFSRPSHCGAGNLFAHVACFGFPKASGPYQASEARHDLLAKSTLGTQLTLMPTPSMSALKDESDIPR